MRLLLLAAALAASPARAGVGRAVELSLPETGTLKPAAAPAVTLQLPAASLSPSLLPGVAAPLSPALAAPAPLTVSPALAAAIIPAPAAPAAPAPAKAVDALRETGAALAKAEPRSAQASAAVARLFDGGASEGEAVAPEGAGSVRAPSLAPSSPRRSRAMPDGVKRAFQNSAVLGGGMAALGGGLFAWTQNLPSAPTPGQFALLAAPLLLIPLHFSLVSGFWAGRYYAYPRLSPAGKSAFEGAWRALSLLYPAAALTAMAAWLQVFGGNTTMLTLMGLPALVALGEVTHHFIYRVVPERAQDKGKALTDWRSRVGGNIGQQLRRMRRKG